MLEAYRCKVCGKKYPLRYFAVFFQQPLGILSEILQKKWDAVTSVNLIISMVIYLRRHLVCTTDCLHEQEWWILMR